jgi:hypothetical protein
MPDTLYLPVSIGEAIDKLTILDIKYDKIKDNDRKCNVKIEFDMLYEKIKDIIEEYKLYYNIMKIINLDIWDMMDILRDANISNEEYLIKCKECIEANDVRFRIKNKINFVAKSVLKEQKGYNILRVGFNLKNENIILSNFINSIKYYSILYDEIVISVNTKDIEFIKNIFNYDPTIIITNDILYNDKIYYNKIFDFTNKNFSLNNIYTELNITEDIISKYFNNF